MLAHTHPPPASLTLDSLRPSHPDLGGLFFFATGLTSLFNSIDSRLHLEREEVYLSVYPCCDVCSAWCWAPWKKHKLAPSTMAPWSNLLVCSINMEREASCKHVLSEAKWLGGDKSQLHHRFIVVDFQKRTHLSEQICMYTHPLKSAFMTRYTDYTDNLVHPWISFSLVLNLHRRLWMRKHECTPMYVMSSLSLTYEYLGIITSEKLAFQ